MPLRKGSSAASIMSRGALESRIGKRTFLRRVVGLCASELRRQANPVRIEIRTQCGRRLVRARACHITVRPHQVERVSMKAGALHRLLPAELMERQMTLDAARTKLRHHAAIDVDLPFE